MSSIDSTSRMDTARTRSSPCVNFGRAVQSFTRPIDVIHSRFSNGATWAFADHRSRRQGCAFVGVLASQQFLR